MLNKWKKQKIQFIHSLFVKHYQKKNDPENGCACVCVCVRKNQEPIIIEEKERERKINNNNKQNKKVSSLKGLD